MKKLTFLKKILMKSLYLRKSGFTSERLTTVQFHALILTILDFLLHAIIILHL